MKKSEILEKIGHIRADINYRKSNLKYAEIQSKHAEQTRISMLEDELDELNELLGDLDNG